MIENIKIYGQFLRVKQYIKNLLIFAPIFFSFSFLEFDKALNGFIAFILFSIASSSIYILNDIYDILEDQLHPEKKKRPIASGKITKTAAFIISILLMHIAILFSFLFNQKVFYVLGAYILVNILYSVRLKHIPILDIFIIALGFVLRVLVGGYATDIKTSMWLIVMSFLVALFFAIAKRRDDIVLGESGLQTRKNISGYNLEFINAGLVMMGGVIIVSYILYTVSENIVARFGTENIYITSFFVIAGILRYMQITFVDGKSGNPTNIFFHDRFLQSMIILWLLSFIIIVKLV
ncbi:MAG: UbiA prenyltransferase family protein [Melioribacteraceae bacterium]|nr:UbiA prenyltransferase family protein [Melioribacteraceae bacterium]